MLEHIGGAIAKPAQVGLLRLFVGDGPGAAVTDRMLQAALQSLDSRTQIDVFGGSETPYSSLPIFDNPETASAFRYHSNVDVEAILGLAPATIAVIDLARENPAGGHHRCVWQDVRDLLAAGRDVFGTMDIRNLESLKDVVCDVSGATIEKAVPDAMFDAAEVEVVDVAESPSKLVSENSEATALRALTLRRVALAIDRRATTRGEQQNASVAVAADQVVVAVGGSYNGEALIKAAKRLASALHAPWHAVYVETPQSLLDSTRRAADTLGLASQMGATISTVAAADVVQGLEFHLARSPATHLVLGDSGVGGMKRLFGRSLLERLLTRPVKPLLHVVPRQAENDDRQDTATEPAATRHSFSAPKTYLYTMALVALTVVVAEMLRIFTGLRGTNLLFLFPVIAAAARLGPGPTLLSVVASVLCFNFFLLAPAYQFDLAAPQNLVMLIVLGSVALYTVLLTAQLRGRAELSDRNAQQSSRLADFAQSLAQSSTWHDTAVCVCEEVGRQMKVRTVMLREQEGRLQKIAAYPSDNEWSPVDQMALEWCWNRGEPTGSGTGRLAAGNWRFDPLKTSLGTLAVLGMAREDGRNPLRADRSVLFATLVTQAALAHERLRLQDELRRAR